MARISFQVQAIPGKKKFKDFQKNFETIMETLLYLQNDFPKIIGNLKDPDDHYRVDVIIAFDADHIEAPDGRKGFGVFDADTDRIYLAADIPESEETLIETTAHEFMHYIQKIKGLPYSEEEAEHFAEFARYQVKRQIIEEKTIEQALKDAAEQAGAKPEEMKTVAVEQVAGIHVFSSDMEKPPIVLIDGEFVDVATLLGYAISEFIDGAVAQGMQRADAERIAIETTKQAIVAARAEAFQKGEKH